MIISKVKGQNISEKDMNTTYGGFGCGGRCGDCDCRSSNGDNFEKAFTPEMQNWNTVLMNPPGDT
ncbi:MAG: hypothetical protein GY765_04185 [bacterium]|nr:hypothetical protein [bacterium]